MALAWWQRGSLQSPQLPLETAVRTGNIYLALEDTSRVVPMARIATGMTLTSPAGRA